MLIFNFYLQAIVRVTDKFDNFVAKNKAAQIQSMGKYVFYIIKSINK